MNKNIQMFLEVAIVVGVALIGMALADNIVWLSKYTFSVGWVSCLVGFKIINMVFPD